VIDLDDLPPDPDWDDVPGDLRILAGLADPVVLTCEDGVSRDRLVVVPSLHAHARRLGEGETD
jgi:hypothetical protein